jgi:putative iron-only hydrogenase system regulator
MSDASPNPPGKECRYGFVGIIVNKQYKQGKEIQAILSAHEGMIIGRQGLPHLDDDRLAIITLIINASVDELGSLTGQLGRLPGVTIKSGLAKALRFDEANQ